MKKVLREAAQAVRAAELRAAQVQQRAEQEIARLRASRETFRVANGRLWRHLEKERATTLRLREEAMGKPTTDAVVLCEVCQVGVFSLAKHQVKAGHGKIWAARQAETGSAKKCRLSTERQGRRVRARLRGAAYVDPLFAGVTADGRRS